MDVQKTILEFEVLAQGIEDMDVNSEFDKIWGLNWHQLADHQAGERLLGVGWGGVKAFKAHNRLLRTCETDFSRLWEETMETKQTVKLYTELVCFVSDEVAGYLIGELLAFVAKFG